MTYYQSTRHIRNRNHMLVLDIPEKNVHLTFRSKSDIHRFLKKVPFNFDKDFDSLIIPKPQKSKILDKIARERRKYEKKRAKNSKKN